MTKKNKINSIVITVKNELELNSSLNTVLGTLLGKIFNINVVPQYTKSGKIKEYIITITFEIEDNKQ